MTWCIFSEGDRPVEGIEYLLYWYDDEDGHTLSSNPKYNTKYEATKAAVRLFGTNGDKSVKMFKKIERPGRCANYVAERY